MSGRDLEATRPVDCVRSDTLEDADDLTQDGESLAMKHFGVPYGSLRRRDQNMIRAVINGNRREIEAEVKSLRRNNMLSVQDRVSRIGGKLEKMGELIDDAIDCAVELAASDPNGVDYDGKKYFKTRGGTEMRKLRHLDRLNKVVQGYIEINHTIAKMSEEPKGTVFIKNENKTANFGAGITPESAADTLGSIVRGEIIGDAGNVGEPDKP